MSETLPRTGAFTRSMSFQSGGRDPVTPRFHMEAIQDKVASAREGRPIFIHQERVQHLIPGSPNQPVEIVNQSHRDRWPEQYEAFKRGEEMAHEGTPLEQWPILNRAQVLELKALGIFTVEQCADLSDTAMQRIPIAGQRIRDRARAYIDEAEKTAFVEKLNRENEALSSRIASLEHQNAELSQLLEKVSAQLTSLRDAPHPIATYVVPEPASVANGGGAASSLDSLGGPPRGPGRPPKRAA